MSTKSTDICRLCGEDTKSSIFPVKTIYKKRDMRNSGCKPGLSYPETGRTYGPLEKKVYHLECLTKLECKDCCGHITYDDVVDIIDKDNFIHINCNKNTCVNHSLAISQPVFENMTIHTKCSRAIKCKTCHRWCLPSLPGWSQQVAHLYPNEIKLNVYTFLLCLYRLPCKVPREIRNIIVSIAATERGKDMYTTSLNTLSTMSICIEEKCRYYHNTGVAIGYNATASGYSSIAIGTNSMHYTPYNLNNYMNSNYITSPYDLIWTPGTTTIGAFKDPYKK